MDTMDTVEAKDARWRRNLALIKIIFWREFNTQYRRTALGPFWALISPTAYLCVFIFFRLLFGLSNPDGIPMVPFLFSGLCLWLLFAQVATSVFPAIISNVSILQKIPISPFVFVLSGSLLPLVTCCIYVVLLEGLLLFYDIMPHASYILLPLVVLAVYLFAIGFGLLIATCAFYKQDIIQVLPTVIQLGMFATPIFFSASIVPESLQWALKINPIAECVEIFRQMLFFGTWPTLAALLKIAGVIACLWAVAVPIFNRTTKYVADMY